MTSPTTEPTPETREQRRARLAAVKREELTGRVRDLADFRTRAAEAKALYDIARANFEAQHAAVIANVKATAEKVATEEDAIRAIAVEVYDIDPSDKKIVPGVTVALGSTVKLTDEDDKAFAFWSERKMFIVPASLDKKALLKFLGENDRATHGYTGYTETPTIGARIATDLDKALAATEKA